MILVRAGFLNRHRGCDCPVGVKYQNAITEFVSYRPDGSQIRVLKIV
jgi:hypothetical protein